MIKVKFSKRARLSITCELKKYMDVETGGVLLGTRKRQVWKVVEALPSGPKSRHGTNFFEYDNEYLEYTANHISALYCPNLELLGVWHSHISNDFKFSREDIKTNYEFAKYDNKGIISVLLCLNPKVMCNIFYIINQEEALLIKSEVW